MDKKVLTAKLETLTRRICEAHGCEEPEARALLGLVLTKHADALVAATGLPAAVAGLPTPAPALAVAG